VLKRRVESYMATIDETVLSEDKVRAVAGRHQLTRAGRDYHRRATIFQDQQLNSYGNFQCCWVISFVANDRRVAQEVVRDLDGEFIDDAWQRFPGVRCPPRDCGGNEFAEVEFFDKDLKPPAWQFLVFGFSSGVLAALGLRLTASQE